jgi:hypothetical protein
MLRVHWVKRSGGLALLHVLFVPFGTVLAAWQDRGSSFYNVKMKLERGMHYRIPHIIRFPSREGD